MSSPPHILVVDDDARLRSLLQKFLQEEGFLITPAVDAKDARQKLAFFAVDLIVLDRMMPGESGVEFAERLRRDNDVPILMLTAMGEVEDRIAGLEAGVDDYLAKPFEPKELLLRIRSVLKRRPVSSREEAQMLAFGEFRFDPERSQWLRAEAPVYLTESEAALLTLLAARRGQTVSRQEIAGVSFESEAGERSVDVLVTRLRKKIEVNPAKPLYLQTVRGIGYVLRG